MESNGPLKLDTTVPGNTPATPPIAAAFLVKFDHRKGYVLQWHRSIEGLEIEGVVELKSLPSGLHNVEQDVVYFVHEEFVGVSAYLNNPDSQSARNANMLAVGVLVPLQQGRMGKAWLYVDELKGLARKTISNPSKTAPLEAFWDDHRIQETKSIAPPDESTDSLFIPKNSAKANGYQKFRAMSAGSVFAPGMHTLASHHPAASLLELLDLFGPLLFPLYRAALLRKRILLVTEAPVEFADNIVYNLSILSSIPRSTLRFLPRPIDPSSLRRKPLFTVGISDIPLLSLESSDGWIACTTDDVLTTKPECFDVLVLLPSSDSKQASRKIYPRIVYSSPDLAKQFPRQGTKATQRDAERYAILREGLRTYPASIVETSIVPQDPEATPPVDGNETALIDDDAASTLSTASTVNDRREIVEPPSWSQVAYTSLLWWASAGDRRVGLSEAEEAEREMDLALLESGDMDDDDGRTKEIALVSYFRRLTSVMFDAAARRVLSVDGRDYDDGEEQDDEQSDGERELYFQDQPADSTALETDIQREEPESQNNDQQPLLPSSRPSNAETNPNHPNPSHTQEEDGDDNSDEEIPFSSEDMASLALDVWSAQDRVFVQDFVRLWWARRVRLQGMGIECCGVKIL